MKYSLPISVRRVFDRNPLRIVSTIAKFSMSLFTFATLAAGPAAAQHDAAYANVVPTAVHQQDIQLLPNIPQPCTVMFHGLTPEVSRLRGAHTLRVRVYNVLGRVIHEETLSSTVVGGAYDVTLVNVAPAIRVRTDHFTLGVSIDRQNETLWPVTIKRAKEFSSDVYVAVVNTTQLEQNASELADRAERDTEAAQHYSTLIREVNHETGNVKIKTLTDYSGTEVHNSPSIRLELAVAGPRGLQYTKESMMQYARASFEVRNLTTLFGGKLGLGVRMMQSGDDFRYQSAGIVDDVNNDGTVIATLGVAKYQSGTSATEPYTVSPFSRIQYSSSTKGLFFYSEIEATVHLHGYLSGTAGLGLSLFGLDMIAGYHYSMYSLPGVESMNAVNGIMTMVNFSF